MFDLRQLTRASIIACLFCLLVLPYYVVNKVEYIAFLCWYVLSRCDFDLWPLDLELLYHFECHASKLCTKFERNRTIHHRVIDDLAGFRRAILGVGHEWQTVLRGAWTQLHQTWRRQRAINPTQWFVLAFGYLLHFQTRAAKRWVLLKTTPNFALFDPSPVKIRGGWARAL